MNLDRNMCGHCGRTNDSFLAVQCCNGRWLYPSPEAEQRLREPDPLELPLPPAASGPYDYRVLMRDPLTGLTWHHDFWTEFADQPRYELDGTVRFQWLEVNLNEEHLPGLIRILAPDDFVLYQKGEPEKAFFARYRLLQAERLAESMTPASPEQLAADIWAEIGEPRNWAFQTVGKRWTEDGRPALQAQFYPPGAPPLRAVAPILGKKTAKVSKLALIDYIFDQWRQHHQVVGGPSLDWAACRQRLLKHHSLEVLA